MKNYIIMALIISALSLYSFDKKDNKDITDNFSNKFVESCKKSFGKLSNLQIEAIKAIIFEWQVYNDLDVNKLIYILATCYHESRFGLFAKEIRAKKGTATYNQQEKYWYTGFYGRGLIQISLEKNYKLFSKLLGIDFVKNPDLVIHTQTAAKIAVIGMHKGLFTGVGLSKYINSTTNDFYNARRVVNGLDKAELIADYGLSIFNNYKILV